MIKYLYFLPLAAMLHCMQSLGSAIVFEVPHYEQLSAIKELMRIVWCDTYVKFYSQNAVDIAVSEQTIEYLQEQLENSAVFFLIAKNAATNDIVGVITSIERDNKTVDVIRLYIHPEYRNCKIGSMLLKKTIEKFSESTLIRIPVKEKNKDALRFYERHGFVAIDKIDDPIGDESAINIIMARKK